MSRAFSCVYDRTTSIASFLRALTVVAICLSFLTPALKGSERWTKYQTRNFELFSPTQESSVYELLRRLEKARDYFAASGFTVSTSEPVRIISFQSDEEFARYRTNPFATALYVGAPVSDYILLKDGASPESYSVALHEYVHQVLRRSGLQSPLWLQEGFAEAFSTAKFQDGNIEIGEVPEARKSLLANRNWLEFAALLAADRSSPILADRRQAELFYSESWALAHMILLSPDYGASCREFLDQLAASANSQQAFRSVYGKSPAEVESDLGAYLKSGRFRTMTGGTAPNPAWNVKTEDATNLELQVARANIFIGTRRNAEARRILEKVSSEYPGSWEAEQAFGFLCWYEADRDDARAHFQRAIQNGLMNAQTCLYYAGLLGEIPTPDSKVIPVVERALELEPGNRKAGLKLASLYLRASRYQDVIALASRNPSIQADVDFQSRIASASEHLGNVDTAGKTAEQMLLASR
jgi:tetratricopeptide (TPR) repeat protein